MEFKKQPFYPKLNEFDLIRRENAIIYIKIMLNGTYFKGYVMYYTAFRGK